jgi:hypothetical protein
MFIDQVTLKRVNIDAPYAGRSKLDTPEIRAEVGVIEIPDPFRESDETHYVQELDDPPYISNTQKDPAVLDAMYKQRVKQIRASTLETFPKNSGIDNVYVLNYQAATLGAVDNTTILRNGKTPAVHLADFGTPLGMTAEQFATYVLAENLAAGAKMTEIESAYLAAYYASTTTAQMVVDYQAFCDARVSTQ